jgi:hypothetical protein
MIQGRHSATAIGLQWAQEACPLSDSAPVPLQMKVPLLYHLLNAQKSGAQSRYQLLDYVNGLRKVVVVARCEAHDSGQRIVPQETWCPDDPDISATPAIGSGELDHVSKQGDGGQALCQGMVTEPITLVSPPATLSPVRSPTCPNSHSCQLRRWSRKAPCLALHLLHMCHGKVIRGNTVANCVSFSIALTFPHGGRPFCWVVRKHSVGG